MTVVLKVAVLSLGLIITASLGEPPTESQSQWPAAPDACGSLSGPSS